MNETLTWIGIVFCITQSAMFSGLNLAFFGVSRLRLEVEKATGNEHAARVLALRQDASFLLTTILWGNVGINVILTLLSDSAFARLGQYAALGAFLFSTILITFVGEIFPQAYFSRHALRMASLLTPVLRVYQILLYVVAKPVALVLDAVLGKEGIQYFGEGDLREIIAKHIDSDSDVDRTEGTGAINFLALDDMQVAEEGEVVDPESVIPLPVNLDLPILPAFARSPDDPFVQQVHASGKKWVILTSQENEPLVCLNADDFLRAALLEQGEFKPYAFCHRPIVVHESSEPLGDMLPRLKVHPERADDDVIDHDIILVWGDEKRVITGADILGRLLRGIATRVSA